MRAPILAILLGSWLLLSSAQARSQDLQVFDVEDFVDPALLKLLGEGQESKVFASLLILGGAGRNLQVRSDFVEGDFTFAHVAGDVYYGDWQFGLDVLDLTPREEDARFSDRLTLEAGRYFTSKTYMVHEKERQIPVRYVARARLAWELERRPGRAPGHAVTVALDTRRDGPRIGAVDPIGGYTYTWVQAGDGDQGHDRHYLSLGLRSPIAAYNNGGKIFLGVGVGIENTLGRFRWGAPRFELVGEVPIRRWESKLRLSWAPAYQLDKGVFKQEVAILLVPPLLSRVFSPALHSFRSSR